MSSNVAKSPGGCFLYTGIEFFEADDEGIKGATVDNLENRKIIRVIKITRNYGLGKLGRMFGDGAENKCGGLFVKAVLLGERVHELRENVRLDHGLSQVVVVVCETAKGERGCLLDRLNILLNLK